MVEGWLNFMRKPKTPRKLLMNKLDKLSKKLVYERDNWTCQHCGKYSKTDYQASHVIPVSAGNKLRWDIKNMKVMCYHCHLNWWHKNPMEASAWFQEKFPDRWAYLQEQRGMYKFTLTELEDMVTKYEELLLENN